MYGALTGKEFSVRAHRRGGWKHFGALVTDLRMRRIDVGAAEILLGSGRQMPRGHATAVEDRGSTRGAPRRVVVPGERTRESERIRESQREPERARESQREPERAKVPVLRPSAAVRTVGIVRPVRVNSAQVWLADGRGRLARQLGGVGGAHRTQVELPSPERVLLVRAPRDRAARGAVAGLAANRTAVAEPCEGRGIVAREMASASLTRQRTVRALTI
jgi:hypothetical protein